MNELSEQMKTMAKRNDLKNYSLYTSQIGQEFFKPSEVIDDQTARACVSRAHELLLLYQSFYVSIAMVTGMAEEGFQRFTEMRLFQDVFQELGSLTDLSDLSSITKEQSLAEQVTFFNSPTMQQILAQFPLFVQELLSASQTQNQVQPDSQETLGKVQTNLTV